MPGGVPLVVQTVPANQHDVTTLLPLVINMPAVAGKVADPNKSRKQSSPTKGLTANRCECFCAGWASSR